MKKLIIRYQMNCWKAFTIIFFSLLCVASSNADTQWSSIWENDDEKEFVLVGDDFTQYFNNDENRQCFTFKVEGVWRHAGVSGLLESTEGKGRVGVLIRPKDFLDKIKSKDKVKDFTPIEKAALIALFQAEQQFPGVSPSHKLQDFETSKYEAKRQAINFMLKVRGETIMAASIKYFIEFKPGWVAQITTGHKAGGDQTAKYIIRNFEFSDSPGCYLPIIEKAKSDLKKLAPDNSPFFDIE